MEKDIEDYYNGVEKKLPFDCKIRDYQSVKIEDIEDNRPYYCSFLGGAAVSGKFIKKYIKELDKLHKASPE